MDSRAQHSATRWADQTMANARQFKIEPRGLRRPDAAHYVGVSSSKFDAWVAEGLMPKPKRQDGCVVWDRYALDRAFEQLPDDGPEIANDWDEALGT